VHAASINASIIRNTYVGPGPESADIPGAGRINTDISDTTASPDQPIMRAATVALLVFMAGVVGGSVMILVMRTRSAAAS
jgi:hypothetical protein